MPFDPAYFGIALPDVWLVFYSRQHYFPLPAVALTEEARGFAVSKVAAAEGQVLPKATPGVSQFAGLGAPAEGVSL